MNRKEIIKHIVSLASKEKQVFNDCVAKLEKIVAELSIAEIRTS